jgi:hypothetical protein
MVDRMMLLELPGLYSAAGEDVEGWVDTIALFTAVFGAVIGA